VVEKRSVHRAMAETLGWFFADRSRKKLGLQCSRFALCYQCLCLRGVRDRVGPARGPRCGAESGQEQSVSAGESSP
jgi:hypothetical protein